MLWLALDKVGDNPVMTRVFLTAAVLPMVLWSQEAKPLELTAEEILEKSIEASGGRAAREKIVSSVLKGEMEMGAQAMRGTIEIYSKAPNKRLTITRIEGLGEVRQGFDGKTGWRKDPSGNVSDITGPQLALLEREATMNGELNWRQLYEKVEVAGKGKVENRETWVLKITPKAGLPMVRYYDAETFLLLRSDITVTGGAKEFALKTFYADYRNVEGVMVPFQITQQMPMGAIGTRITEVRYNVPLDDSLFSKPEPAPAPPAPASK